MNRAPLEAICEPIKIACLNKSPDFCRRRANGAVFTGRVRTKPKNRPDFDYLSILSLPPFIDWRRLENGAAQERQLGVGERRQVEQRGRPARAGRIGLGGRARLVACPMSATVSPAIAS